MICPGELPFVSICLLTYKRAAVLPRSIDSLLGQTHRDFELIINDDRSPDETESICRDYEKRDTRVKYFRNERNLRYAGNQTAAIGRARGEYVAIVHDGDIYRSDLIEKWTRALVKHPTAALVFNGAESIDEQGRVTAVHRHPYGELVRGHVLLDQMLQQSGSPIYGIVMVRRSAVLVAGPFDERIPTLADVDMWMRLLLRGDAAYLNESLLQIAAREPGHYNSLGNWKVMAEQELIYRLNLPRRFPRRTPEAEQVLENCRRVLRRARLMTILVCLKRGLWRKAAQGVVFSLSATFPDPWRERPSVNVI